MAQELRHRLRGGGRRESIRLLVRNGPPPACPDPSRVDYHTSETFTHESYPPAYGLDTETSGEEVSRDSEREEDATSGLEADQLDIPIGRSQSRVETLYATDDISSVHTPHRLAGSAICSPEVTGFDAATFEASDDLPDERDRSRTTTHGSTRKTQAEESADRLRATVNSDDASDNGSVGDQQAYTAHTLDDLVSDTPPSKSNTTPENEFIPQETASDTGSSRGITETWCSRANTLISSATSMLGKLDRSHLDIVAAWIARIGAVYLTAYAVDTILAAVLPSESESKTDVATTLGTDRPASLRVQHTSVAAGE